MDTKQSAEDFSPAKAVLLGALAPGVNGPTWNTLKVAFFMLGICLSAMLGLAFSSSDSALVLHVTLLVLIMGTLFFLLSSETEKICADLALSDWFQRYHFSALGPGRWTHSSTM